MPRNENNSKFTGTVLAVREVEDCIRATKKYTKGVFRRKVQHPIQGGEFPSKVISEYYEVYPSVEVRGGAIWGLPASVGWAWVWGDEKHIDVLFKYDYRENKASVIIEDGAVAVRELARGIPNFSEALAKVIAVGNGKANKV